MPRRIRQVFFFIFISLDENKFNGEKHFIYVFLVELNDSWSKFLQRTYENSDQIGQWYINKLYRIMFKFIKAYRERNLYEIIASLAETVPYMKNLLPHINCASIRYAYIGVIQQVEILVSKKPYGQKGFEDLNEYLRKVTAIVSPVIA